MTKKDGADNEPTLISENSDELTKYGITKVSVNYFHLGEYRYSNLRDAITQAKRTVKAE